MPLPGPISLPAVFGRYVLLERLSRGGMGEIFLAQVGELQGFEKPIVIKKILPKLARDDEFLELFVKEARLSIQLTHGNLAQVYEAGMVEGQYFLAMEYVEGRDLRRILTRAAERGMRLPLDICLLLIREVANGLAYAHRRTDDQGRPLELVHCDISPPNVLVSYEGEVKVIDFGVARSAMQRAQEEQDLGFGKFGYMAPEQMVRAATVDRRADIYSTGVLLHELLTGERVFPFAADTSFRQVARVVTDARVRPPSALVPGLPPELDRLVMRAMQVTPQLRFQSAEQLRDAVQQQLYAKNPTISTDDLARVIKDLFAAEVAAGRLGGRVLPERRVASICADQTDGHSSHTVTFALAGIFDDSRSGSGSPAPDPGPQRLDPPPPVSGPLSSDPPPRPMGGTARSLLVEPSDPRADGPGGAPSTREMSVDEQRRTLDGPSPPAPPPKQNQPPAPPGSRPVAAVGQAGGQRRTSRRGPAMLASLVVVLLLALGVTVALVVGLSGPTDQMSDGETSPPGVESADAGPADIALDRSTPEAAVAAVGEPPALEFEPDPVRPGPTTQVRPKPRRKKTAPRRRRKTSAAQVQRKFQSVRREYQAFVRAYGQQLDSSWQKILFAHTYGSKDHAAYRKLNVMLDGLRRRMKKVKNK